MAPMPPWAISSSISKQTESTRSPFANVESEAKIEAPARTLTQRSGLGDPLAFSISD